jgi:hypothetical protein
MRDRLKFGGAFQKGGQGSFCSETFYNSYENLLKMPKCNEISRNLIYVTRTHFTHTAKTQLHKKVRSVYHPTRGVCYAPNCTAPLWAACIVLHSRKQILENCACCQCCFQQDTNASCRQCISMHITCPNSIYYETIKTATGVMRLLSLWIKLGY